MADKFDMPQDILGRYWEEEAAARRIWFLGGVNESNILALCIWLKKLTDGDPREYQPIQLFLSSPGGSFWDGLAGVAAIELCPAPIHTLAIGQVSSMAISLLAVSPQRTASRHTRFMIHSVAWDKEDTMARDMRMAGEAMEEWDAWQAELLAEYTKKPKKFWQAMLDDTADHRFAAKEALEWGLIDEIV